MEQQYIDAIFENGLFRPLQPLRVDVRDGEHVRLRIEDQPSATAIELAGDVYDGLSKSEIEEIERIALDHSDFFGPRNRD